MRTCYRNSIAVLLALFLVPDPACAQIREPVFRRAAASVIGLSPTSVSLSTVEGAAEPAPQVVLIAGLDRRAIAELRAEVSYAAGQPSGWISASLNTSTRPSKLTLRPTTGDLPAGVYTATVVIASAPASNSPQSASITLTVAPKPSVAPAPYAGTWRLTPRLTLQCRSLPQWFGTITTDRVTIAGQSADHLAMSIPLSIGPALPVPITFDLPYDPVEKTFGGEAPLSFTVQGGGATVTGTGRVWIDGMFVNEREFSADVDISLSLSGNFAGPCADVSSRVTGARQSANVMLANKRTVVPGVRPKPRRHGVPSLSR